MRSRDRDRARWVGSLVLALAALGASSRGQSPEVPKSGPARPPEPIELLGVENAFRLSPRLYSGSQPEGTAGFEALAKLGVRTIISVDGSTPDVEAARKLGLRYVHLPIGYDGVPREQALRLIRATRTLPGPVFVHCHHGKHRGPAAAAVCEIAAEGWSREDATAWMKRAGTSGDYRGLFASVKDFAIPSDDELDRVGGELPERAETPAMVGRMVAIDALWDRIGAIRQAGFRAPADHPDLDPSHEALMLEEQFRELARSPDAKGRGADLIRQAEASASLAAELRSAFRAIGEVPSDESRKRAEMAYDAVGRACTSCHVRHRND
ncbi:hypothetical protein P12x_005651 [Tundrisphaera lichenicola]|uniref:hypothetical protein n=1 Tax=Tundrisphaera lichenicola TaxID=2029860 RepID=UPI003EB8D4A3